jgi:hypothetical protein
MMKKGYKVGLFFVLIIFAFVAGALWFRHSLNIEARDEILENSDFGEDIIGNITVIETNNEQIKTTCDTVCIYEDIDQNDGSMVIVEAKLPAKYIGLKRDEFEAMLADDNKFYTLDNKLSGLKSQHLELFSAEKVKILRIYDTSTELTGFYIMAVNGDINVYKSDKKTLYFKTGLRLESLPYKVQGEVLEGKYLDSEIQVYHFIESYSS